MAPPATYSLIRPALPSDRVAIEDIVAAAYGRYIARIGDKPGPMRDDYGALIAQGVVEVLEAGGIVQGLLVLVQEGDVMLLDNVAVRPEAQGMGFGGRLLAHAEQTAANAGCRSIRLYTHEKMTENIDRYLRNGFVETHRARDAGLDRVFMAKQLHTTTGVMNPSQ